MTTCQPVQYPHKVYTADDAGIYLDGARGQYIGEAVQELAASHGWKYSAQFEIVRVDDGDDPEVYTWAWNEAEDYLNTLTDGTVYFGSTEGGDWGLWPVEDDS
jgi:hypothetical protein